MKIKKIFYLGFCLFSFQILTGQSLLKNVSKGAYFLYSRHFSTNYVIDSAFSNFVSRKMNIGIEAGVNLDILVKKSWSIRTGLYAHLHFISEIDYGTTGELPPVIPSTYRKESITQYTRGSEYAERTNISIPLKGLFRIKRIKDWEFYSAAGIVGSFYFPARQQLVQNTIVLPTSSGSNNFITHYEIIRYFKKSTFTPRIEFGFDLEAVRKFRRRGAVFAGIKTHLGTTKLERADFIIWPGLPQYRSKGHFSLNRSYIGVYLGYRFGRNDFKN